MKVVIDTNVFISSFFGGKPKAVIDLWKTGRIRWCLSGPLLDEYIEILNRLGVKNSSEVDELLALFARQTNILFVKKPPIIKAVERDPDDDQVISCAVALKADVIVTGDRDLLDLRTFRSIRILAPDRFLRDFQ